jgi:tRNA(adenine34) deaminase
MRATSDGTDLDQEMMRRSIALAVMAGKSGNTPVGCVVTLERQIVAEAEERSPNGKDPFAHAEILAVAKAMGTVGRLKMAEATLYTTNEPCFLCSYAIREARIGRVVFAVETPGIGGATSDHPILSANNIDRWNTPPQIEQGLLEAEYRQTTEGR